MERTAVESSQIVSIGYVPGLETLEIEFKGGKVYRYFEVPGAAHADLVAAESKGKFFGQYIRGKFTFEKVEPEAQTAAA